MNWSFAAQPETGIRQSVAVSVSTLCGSVLDGAIADAFSGFPR